MKALRGVVAGHVRWKSRSWVALLLVAAGVVTAEAAPFAYVANNNSNSVSVTASQPIRKFAFLDEPATALPGTQAAPRSSSARLMEQMRYNLLFRWFDVTDRSRPWLRPGSQPRPQVPDKREYR